MSPPEQFVHDLAQLVWLLVYRPARVEDQKRALRAVLLHTSRSDQRVETSIVALAAAQGALVTPPSDLTKWLAELSTRMAGHSVRVINVAAGARAAELLGIARALAAPLVRNDHGVAFDTQIMAIGLNNISVQLGRDGFVRLPTPVQGVLATLDRSDGQPGGDFTGSYAVPIDSEDEVAVTASPAMLEADLMPSSSRLELSSRLRGEIPLNQLSKLLDEVIRGAEDAVRREDWVSVLDLATAILSREKQISNPDLKRAFSLQLTRLARPNILRGLAQMLPDHRGRRDELHELLARLGNPAADVLLDLLIAAESARDRRSYRDALRACPAAIEPLCQMLTDHRWFVVRNAAELLGEMNATNADQPLIHTLRHADPRVRQAATLALIKLGTPHAVHTIIRALTDPDPTMRQRAAQGLAAVSSPRAVPALLRVLDEESVPDVQHAILGALGALATPPAVERLAEESAPGSLLKRRPVARRLAAAQALAMAGTSAALAVLRSLASDREPSMRELVDRLLRETEPRAAIPAGSR